MAVITRSIRAYLMGHVKDSAHFDVPQFMAPGGRIEIPQPLLLEQPIIAAQPKHHIEPFDLKITKFMVIETAVALVLVLIFVPIANRMTRRDRPRGKFWNFFEGIMVFIRDQVARPAIAHVPPLSRCR